jgi:NADPH:quinone reductase-like Zn-dependent oxidoreductase
MWAMVLNNLRPPLEWTELPDRQPASGQIRVNVTACGVCRTDLHVVDGELPDPRAPIIPGHEIVGRIDAIGAGVEGLTIGERASASRGSVTPAGFVLIAARTEKIYATIQFSRDIRAMAVSRRRRLPMRASPSRLAKPGATCPSPRCSAPG